MKRITCSYCGEEKLTSVFLRDYKYKQIERETGKPYYFCCYTCMKKAVEENLKNYKKKRD